MPDSHCWILCTDLDRTLVPNGDAPESALARPLFARLVTRPEIILIYVSGRDAALVKTAMHDYQLPQPDYVIADVGASIWQVGDAYWEPLRHWQWHIAQDWHGQTSKQLRQAIGDIAGLELQPEAKQGEYKLSYQFMPAFRLEEMQTLLQQRLEHINVYYNCIGSVDETIGQGLIDVLPRTASKYLAMDFLAQELGINRKQWMFSGDSGNDMDVFMSPYNATLVANATAEIKALAMQKAGAAGQEHTLYIAKGLSPELNGNYAAGIIEGFMHYFPETSSWLNIERNHE